MFKDIMKDIDNLYFKPTPQYSYFYGNGNGNNCGYIYYGHGDRYENGCGCRHLYVGKYGFNYINTYGNINYYYYYYPNEVRYRNNRHSLHLLISKHKRKNHV